MREELEELKSDEKHRQETELKAAKERRKAVEDLEKGVSETYVEKQLLLCLGTKLTQIRSVRCLFRPRSQDVEHLANGTCKKWNPLLRI